MNKLCGEMTAIRLVSARLPPQRDAYSRTNQPLSDSRSQTLLSSPYPRQLPPLQTVSRSLVSTILYHVLEYARYTIRRRS